MKRWISLGIAMGLLCACAAAADKKKAGKKGISRPPGMICWTIKDKEIKAEYTIVPLECVSPKAHERCRKLVNEGEGKGFMFFIVIINNKRGKEPIKFSAYGGDAHFYWFPPKKDEHDKTEKAPEPRKLNLISLKNYFAEKRTNADKVGYKRIQEMFKTNLTVAPGSYGWSLTCIRDSFVFNIKGPRPNQVLWAIPGSETGMEPMKVKRFNKSLLKKAGVELFKD
ncbi:MAG: hypothetical protein GXP25_06420 [Planctomycetes bacterium]|nr:hypothetical protein [Planctomycetota bacterium]